LIGYGRSGHTLVGSLLDGHPRVVIANERCTFSYLRAHPETPPDKLFGALARNSARCDVYGRLQTNTNYSYDTLPWQGRWCEESSGEVCTPTRIEVVGDKCGGGSSRAFSDSVSDDGDPRGIATLIAFSQTYLRMPIRSIHVVRNPFDMAATDFIISDVTYHADCAPRGNQCDDYWTCYRSQKALLAPPNPPWVCAANATLGEVAACEASLSAAIASQVGSIRTNAAIRLSIARSEGVGCVTGVGNARACESMTAPGAISWLDVNYESTVARPVAHMRAMTEFLGVAVLDEYVDAAAAVIAPVSARPRDLVTWPRAAVESALDELRDIATSGKGTSAGPLLGVIAPYFEPSNLPAAITPQLSQRW